MPTPTSPLFPALRAASFIAFATLTGLLIGCRSHPAVPDTTEAPFAGPAITIDSSADTHILAVDSPSPGWAFTLDRVLEAHGHRRAFVSLRRPNPGYLMAQVIVTQRLSTGVRTDKQVRVLARFLDYDAPADVNTSYAPAAVGPAR